MNFYKYQNMNGYPIYRVPGNGVYVEVARPDPYRVLTIPTVGYGGMVRPVGLIVGSGYGPSYGGAVIVPSRPVGLIIGSGPGYGYVSGNGSGSSSGSRSRAETRVGQRPLGHNEGFVTCSNCKREFITSQENYRSKCGSCRR
jgi:hypothetical protein